MMATEVEVFNTSVPLQVAGSQGSEPDRSPNDAVTSLNYYDDPGDGSLPEPVFVEV